MYLHHYLHSYQPLLSHWILSPQLQTPKRFLLSLISSNLSFYLDIILPLHVERDPKKTKLLLHSSSPFHCQLSWKRHAAPLSYSSALGAQQLGLKTWLGHTHFPETAVSKRTNCFRTTTKYSGLLASASISASAILNPHSLLRALFPWLLPHRTLIPRLQQLTWGLLLVCPTELGTGERYRRQGPWLQKRQPTTSTNTDKRVQRFLV